MKRLATHAIAYFMTAAPASRHAIAFVFFTVLLDMIGFGLIIPVQPTLIRDVAHVTVADAALIGSWLYFVFSIAQFLFAPALGNLSDAYGRRPLLLIAVFGLGLDFLIVALAPSIIWLFIGRTLSGVCGGSYTIAYAFIADITKPEGRARAFGILGASFGLGFVIGPALGGLLGAFGPRVPFFAAAAISLINFAFGYFVLPETLAPQNRRHFSFGRSNPIGTLRIFATHRQVLPLCALLALFSFATSVYPAIWPYWTTARFNATPAIIGITLAVFGTIMAITQGLLTGPLVKRFGEWAVARAGLILSPVGMLIFAFAPNLWVVFAGLFIHAPEAFIAPMLTTIMSQAVPENAQGELQGGIASITNISMMFGTVFYGLSFRYFSGDNLVWVSPSMSFVIAAALMGVTLALFSMVGRWHGSKNAEI